MVDWLPVASQLKSVVQVTFGDRQGARNTQERFIRQCPLISQVTSAIQVGKGDRDAARKTQLEFLSVVSGVVDNVPLVGHVKGGLHYARGNKNRGDAAMKAASHTSAAIVEGIGGFFAGGPVGAAFGGIAAGTAMDSFITISEYGVSRKYKPEGILRPLSDPKDPGKWVDGAMGMAMDGFIGKGAGFLVSKTHLNQPSFFHVTVTDEKKKAVESLVKLAAQTVAITTCTTIATRSGEEFGERLCAKFIDDSDFNNDDKKVPQILEH